MKDKTLHILEKVLIGLLFVMPLFFVKMTLDSDFWFIVNHGRYILSNGFPITEPFTVHSEYAFSIQKWLTCVLFYGIYDHFGNIGMDVFLYVASAVTEGLMYLTLKYISKNTFVSAGITSLSMLMLNHAFMVTRPQIFSYIFILLEIYFLERYVRTDNRKNLIALPIISFLYMQFHSTQWIMLFIILLCYLCDFSFIKIERIKSGEVKKLPIALSIIPMVVAGAINPYGVDTFLYIYRSLTDNSHYSGILECQPADIRTAWIFAPGLVFFIYGLWKNKAISLRFLYLALGTFAMGLIAIRNKSYAILGFAIASADIWNDFSYIENKKNFKQTIFPLIIGCITISCIGLYRLVNPVKTTGNDILDVVNTMSVNVEPSREVNVFTPLNVGAYAEWMGYTAYIDARTEVFAKSINETEDTFDEYRNFITGRTAIEYMQAKYGFDYYIISNNDAVMLLFVNNGYTLVYQNNTYSVFQAK